MIAKASRTGWLVVVCERNERLGGLKGPLDESSKESIELACVLRVF